MEPSYKLELTKEEEEYPILAIDLLLEALRNKELPNPIRISKFKIEGEVHNKIKLIANIEHELNFQDCVFLDHFSIIKSTFKSNLSFRNCKFKNAVVVLPGVTVEGILSFIGCYADSFWLSGGTYKNIGLSFSSKIDYHISNGSFDTLFLSASQEFGINVLRIAFALNNFDYQPDATFGHIELINQKVDQLSFGGYNRGKRFTFHNLQVRILHFFKFVNEGSISFYGLNFPETYLDSELRLDLTVAGKLLFFRTDFSNVKGVLIKDSLIIESSFANVKWGVNVLTRRTYKSDNETPTDVLRQIREAYRQIKYVYDKQGDKIEENEFYAHEMTTYGSILDQRLHHSKPTIPKTSKFIDTSV